MKVVVVSPNAADSSLAVGFLADHGMETRVCQSVADLGPLVATGIGCVVLVEEALVEPDVTLFHEALQTQPPWSNLPLLLIAARDTSLTHLVESVFPESGNVTLLQRPLHPVTFVSAVNMALRSRARQLEVRDLLAQREAAVRHRDEFLAMLAHELRNPLAPIRNAVFLLSTLGYQDALFLKCRAMIEKQASHITRLVDDLLDVSRLELGKVGLRLQGVDLNDCLAAAVEAAAPTTSVHHHEVHLRLWEEPLLVRADPVRIEQVIGNLLSNAAKFTPRGGTIEVESRIEDGHAVASVSDNGIGIKREMLESIFELFTQESVSAARTNGGLGIGLTLVKRLMELHGGSVHAMSEGLGTGACFELRLPLDVAAAKHGVPARGFEPAPDHARRVLIVEDGTDARDSLGMLIEAWDHEVLYAANGPEGVRLARAERPDVALIDIGLPGFDGYEVAREIRRDGSLWARSVRLIALTGYGQAADRAKALDAGFDLHVLKPVDPARLKQLLTAPELST